MDDSLLRLFYLFKDVYLISMNLITEKLLYCLILICD